MELRSVRLRGTPLTLARYPAAGVESNSHFGGHSLGPLERIFLPPSLTGLMDGPPESVVEFLEDDNRGAVSADPVAVLDGVDFHLSVKGVGSSIDPFSTRPLDREMALSLTDDEEVRGRLRHPTVRLPPGQLERLITGELWLRGSPYGGQGLEHARTALKVSELADLTSIHGFLIAPVVKLVFFPAPLEEKLRSIHWYRRYRAPFVQEIRLVPSNVRIYFHAKSTVGNNVRSVFDLFGLTSDAKALAFEMHFIRSTMAMLTLFARSLREDPKRRGVAGLDFLDVWLDKDAVLAPNGSVYFVDLEGVEEVPLERGGVAEKIEDQVFRSLYEFMYAYEQIEGERGRRFGATASRKGHFESLLRASLRDDPFLRLRTAPHGVQLQIRNALFDESLYTTFPLLDLP